MWWVLEERGFQLLGVNAWHVKILPGRKTDVADAAWPAGLLEHGLLPGQLCAAGGHPPAAGSHPRPQAAGSRPHRRGPARPEDPGDAGIKLDSVAADVLGVWGRAMLAALVAGQRDPQVLAELARGRLRTKLPQLRQALRGRFSDHHALLLRLAPAHLEAPSPRSTPRSTG